MFEDNFLDPFDLNRRQLSGQQNPYRMTAVQANQLGRNNWNPNLQNLGMQAGQILGINDPQQANNFVQGFIQNPNDVFNRYGNVTYGQLQDLINLIPAEARSGEMRQLLNTLKHQELSKKIAEEHDAAQKTIIIMVVIAIVALIGGLLAVGLSVKQHRDLQEAQKQTIKTEKITEVKNDKTLPANAPENNKDITIIAHKIDTTPTTTVPIDTSKVANLTNQGTINVSSLTSTVPAVKYDNPIVQQLIDSKAITLNSAGQYVVPTTAPTNIPSSLTALQTNLVNSGTDITTANNHVILGNGANNSVTLTFSSANLQVTTNNGLTGGLATDSATLLATNGGTLNSNNIANINYIATQTTAATGTTPAITSITGSTALYQQGDPILGGTANTTTISPVVQNLQTFASTAEYKTFSTGINDFIQNQPSNYINSLVSKYNTNQESLGNNINTFANNYQKIFNDKGADVANAYMLKQAQVSAGNNFNIITQNVPTNVDSNANNLLQNAISNGQKIDINSAAFKTIVANQNTNLSNYNTQYIAKEYGLSGANLPTNQPSSGSDITNWANAYNNALTERNNANINFNSISSNIRQDLSSYLNVNSGYINGDFIGSNSYNEIFRGVSGIDNNIINSNANSVNTAWDNIGMSYNLNTQPINTQVISPSIQVYG